MVAYFAGCCLFSRSCFVESPCIHVSYVFRTRERSKSVLIVIKDLVHSVLSGCPVEFDTFTNVKDSRCSLIKTHILHLVIVLVARFRSVIVQSLSPWRWYFAWSWASLSRMRLGSAVVHVNCLRLVKRLVKRLAMLSSNGPSW